MSLSLAYTPGISGKCLVYSQVQGLHIYNVVIIGYGVVV